MSIKLRIKKTDTRYNLHRHGFTHFIEFPADSNEFNIVQNHCRTLFKQEFWYFNTSVHRDGNWKSVYLHKNKRWYTNRIYFKGEKFITTLRLAVPQIV